MDRSVREARNKYINFLKPGDLIEAQESKGTIVQKGEKYIVVKVWQGRYDEWLCDIVRRDDGKPISGSFYQRRFRRLSGAGTSKRTLLLC